MGDLALTERVYSTYISQGEIRVLCKSIIYPSLGGVCTSYACRGSLVKSSLSHLLAHLASIHGKSIFLSFPRTFCCLWGLNNEVEHVLIGMSQRKNLKGSVHIIQPIGYRLKPTGWSGNWNRIPDSSISQISLTHRVINHNHTEVISIDLSI